jgi:hypothetical protein
MHFHLPSLPTVVLTVAKNHDRIRRLRGFLEHNGYRQVRWVYGEPTRNHHAGARRMALETLQSLRCPALWIEDDATPLAAYRAEIEIPAEAQIAYLGGSRAGRSRAVLHAMPPPLPALHEGLPRFPVPNPAFVLGHNVLLYGDAPQRQWIRVFSMASGHAILWLDDAARQDMLRRIQAENGPYDISMSRHQWRSRIYALRQPWFYQQDGRNDNDTLSYCPP